MIRIPAVVLTIATFVVASAPAFGSRCEEILKMGYAWANQEWIQMNFLCEETGSIRAKVHCYRANLFLNATRNPECRDEVERIMVECATRTETYGEEATCIESRLFKHGAIAPNPAAHPQAPHRPHAQHARPTQSGHPHARQSTRQLPAPQVQVIKIRPDYKCLFQVTPRGGEQMMNAALACLRAAHANNRDYANASNCKLTLGPVDELKYGEYLKDRLNSSMYGDQHRTAQTAFADHIYNCTN